MLSSPWPPFVTQGEWQMHRGSQGKMYLWSELSQEPWEVSCSQCCKRGCFMPSRLKGWDISLCLYNGCWKHLPFISSALVFQNSYFFPVWVSLAKCPAPAPKWRTGQILKKVCLSTLKICALETKHSLESDDLSSLHLPAFERLLLYRHTKTRTECC